MAAVAAILMALYPPWIHTAEIALRKPAEGGSAAESNKPAEKSKPAEESKSAEEKKSKDKDEAESKGKPEWREIHVASTYGWIGQPPRPPTDWHVPKETYWSVGLDTQRLVLQYGLLVVLCGLAWFCFVRNDPPRDDGGE